MTTKKHIYLDVDGVINAISMKPPVQNTGWEGEWRTEKVDGYNILFSVELIERLNALAAREDVQITWLTTWCDRAASMISPALGLNGEDWPVISATKEEMGYDRGWWKLAKLRQHRKLHGLYGPSYWLDDDLHFYQPAVKYVDEEYPHLRAISPIMHHGLTKKHIEEIEAFFAN